MSTNNNNEGMAESIITHIPPNAHGGSSALKYQTNPNVVSRHSLSKSRSPTLINLNFSASPTASDCPSVAFRHQGPPRRGARHVQGQHSNDANCARDE